MVTRPHLILYWDSSAVVSAVIPGPDHREARGWTAHSGAHLMSSLTWAEVLAVLYRLERDQEIPAPVARTAHQEIARVRWRRIEESPDWAIVQELAARWPLRGADLWHLALAKTLQQEQPRLRLLSFDRRLAEAAAGEGLAAPRPP